MIEIDGSQYSGSGTIVRQAVAFSALTGKPVHILNARAKRDKPGLRRQHTRVIEAITELTNGTAKGVYEGSQEFHFRPGISKGQQEYLFDIGSAGSTTMLALGILPVLGFRPTKTAVEIRGGLFQDFAPSVFHLQHVIQPLLLGMGLKATMRMERPGYVPTGNGALSVKVQPMSRCMQPMVLDQQGSVKRIWGIALASHLAERQVSHRMAETARKQLLKAGFDADIDQLDDSSAKQPGAALALFADCAEGVRLGSDQAGAPRRRSEHIGRSVASQLLADLDTEATVDRFAADQLIPFTALAKGESQFIIPSITEHVQTSAWLAELILGAKVTIKNQRVSVKGIGFCPSHS
ncbi:MAG: RNA 3'-phosphate cyclase [Nitrospirota bacterium]|nr:MAG: RNA 3'-phosphate cyclase [Nitrospirota bacterium]